VSIVGWGRGGDLVIDRVVGDAIWVTNRACGRSVVSSRPRWESPVVLAARVLWFSGEGGDALVGVEHDLGAGPAVEDADDVVPGSSHDAGGGVPQLPAQRFGFGDGEGSAETEQLEPADQVGGVTDNGEPGLVGGEVTEGEPQQPRRFQPADVVLDMGVGAHVSVEDRGVAGGVGVVTPVAVVE
jgi:hypothetical protein